MENLSFDNWLSISWLYPETLRAFQWEAPIFYYLILAIPLLFLFRGLLNLKFRQKLFVALPERKVKSSPLAMLRFVPKVLMGCFLAFLLLAMARPQLTNEQIDRWTEGIDIMLVLDISHSMQIEDFSPNRLEAAKKVAKDFIGGRFQDRIGLVIFSGEAISYSPLTTDYQLLNQLIDAINFEMIGKSGTAIGSALAVGTNRMRESTAQSKVLILLSDGDNTAGSIDPITAANLTFAYGIKIYTIGVGREGRVPFGTDMFGRTQYIESSLDETSLREIARIGEGKYFRATSNNTLDDVFKQINQYEKSEIKESRYKDTKDYYPIYLYWALLFFFLWLLTKSSFMVNALED